MHTFRDSRTLHAMETLRLSERINLPLAGCHHLERDLVLSANECKAIQPTSSAML